MRNNLVNLKNGKLNEDGPGYIFAFSDKKRMGKHRILVSSPKRL